MIICILRDRLVGNRTGRHPTGRLTSEGKAISARLDGLAQGRSDPHVTSFASSTVSSKSSGDPLSTLGACTVCGGPIMAKRPHLRSDVCSPKCAGKLFRITHPGYMANLMRRLRSTNAEYRHRQYEITRAYKRKHIQEELEYGPSVTCPRCNGQGTIIIRRNKNLRTGRTYPAKLIVRHRLDRTRYSMHSISKSKHPRFYGWYEREAMIKHISGPQGMNRTAS